MAIEEPEYRVVKEYEGFELRRYAAFLIAATEVQGEFDAAGNRGFRILFDYISGNNEQAELVNPTISFLFPRIEAGLILNGVEFHNAAHCLIESQKSTPYELGLGWTVDLDREPFCGQRALKTDQAAGPQLALVGLELDWDEQEALYAKHGLPVQVHPGAWRSGVPVYDSSGNRQIGKATSGAWSPLIKKNLALASVETPYARTGTTLKIEYTVEYRRKTVTAVVATLPFYNPEHKRR